MVSGDRDAFTNSTSAVPLPESVKTENFGRVLLVFGLDTNVYKVALQLTQLASYLDPQSIRTSAYASTGSYRVDPNRKQEFVSVFGAIQLDYDLDVEIDLIELLNNSEIHGVPDYTTISIGRVVRILPPVSPFLLLLGAQRKRGISVAQFSQHWANVHAPNAAAELREAPVPIGYDLFLVDADLSEAATSQYWQSSGIDGWMHITTGSNDDFSKIASTPEHRKWVLEDEANFVNFESPLVGQQLKIIDSETP